MFVLPAQPPPPYEMLSKADLLELLPRAQFLPKV